MSPVLYAEDTPDDVFFMQYAFEEAGFPNPLVSVKNGQEAMDYLAGRGHFADRDAYPFPCLLLLDLKMPLKDGFDVLRWVRGRPELKALRVVVVSASDQDCDLQLAQSLDIIDYVVKPTSPSRLVKLLKQRRALWFGR